MDTLAQQITAAIDSLPTFELRMIAEAIAELLTEEAISEREAKRQLAANGIKIEKPKDSRSDYRKFVTNL